MRALVPIVDAMHRSATGYNFPYDERRNTTTTTRVPGPLVDGKKTWVEQSSSVTVVVAKIQQVPADIAAGIFVLKNRARKHWYNQSPRPCNLENPGDRAGEAAQRIRDAIYAIRELEGYLMPEKPLTEQPPKEQGCERPSDRAHGCRQIRSTPSCRPRTWRRRSVPSYSGRLR